MNKRSFFSLLASSAVLALSLSVAGCGGAADSSGGNNALVRLANLTEQPTMELFANGSAVATGIAPSTASAYLSLDKGDTTLQARASGAPAGSVSASLAKGRHYSLVSYTTTGSTTKAVLLDDNEAAPGAGSSKLRVLNASADAPSVDVYLTTPSRDLATALPIHSSVAAEQVSGFADPTSNSYRLRVTVAGSTDKVLLDVPSVTLASQQVVTLALHRTTGGVLLHGLLLVQQGTATAQRNPSVRMRLVAGAAGGAAVAASVGGVALSAGLTSPSIGAYVLVPAGSTSATVSAGGNTVAAGTLPTTTGGEDITLLVTGAPTAATARWLVEANGLPAGSSQTTLRLVHGLNNVGELSMTANGVSVASGVSLGGGGAATLASGTAQLQITTPSVTGALYNDDNATLAANAVYSVFVLGESASAPSVQIRSNR